jgi:hypothetical protein
MMNELTGNAAVSSIICPEPNLKAYIHKKGSLKTNPELFWGECA